MTTTATEQVARESVRTLANAAAAIATALISGDTRSQSAAITAWRKAWNAAPADARKAHAGILAYAREAFTMEAADPIFGRRS